MPIITYYYSPEPTLSPTMEPSLATTNESNQGNMLLNGGLLSQNNYLQSFNRDYYAKNATWYIFCII